MLVLSRKQNQQIRVGNDVTITILKIRGNSVRIGIDAPRSVHVIRGELERQEAASDTLTIEFRSNGSTHDSARPELNLIPLAEHVDSGQCLKESTRMREMVSRVAEGQRQAP